MIRPEAKPFQLENRALTIVERNDIVRQVVDEAEQRILALAGNPTYRRAWKIALRALDGMKP